jgi:hypothetical protein
MEKSSYFPLEGIGWFADWIFGEVVRGSVT